MTEPLSIEARVAALVDPTRVEQRLDAMDWQGDDDSFLLATSKSEKHLPYLHCMGLPFYPLPRLSCTMYPLLPQI